jgi:hypothetical protein
MTLVGARVDFTCARAHCHPRVSLWRRVFDRQTILSCGHVSMGITRRESHTHITRLACATREANDSNNNVYVDVLRVIVI